MAQAGMRFGVATALAVLLALAGRAGGPNTVDAAASVKPALPQGPIARAMVEVQTGQIPIPPPYPVLPGDTCGASPLAWLVGRLRTDIPIPVDLTHRRVACTTCVLAPDVRLDRLNILFDAQTDKVVRLTCG